VVPDPGRVPRLPRVAAVARRHRVPWEKTAGKAMVCIAVEVKSPMGFGRARLQVIPGAKRSMLNSYQSYPQLHLQSYCDEWAFQFNRRKSEHRGQLFLRPLENAVLVAVRRHRRRRSAIAEGGPTAGPARHGPSASRRDRRAPLASVVVAGLSCRTVRQQSVTDGG